VNEPIEREDNSGGVLYGFQPPVKSDLNWLATPLNAWFAPKFLGTEHVDAATPALYVGNHTVYGLIDISVFCAELYSTHGIYLRGLADRNHFMLPGWRDTLVRLGAVMGTRENCSALMEGGEQILVFPGGGREVMKRKGERYKLIWKNRTGFARMAIRHGYPIVPFASVGMEDAYDILWDAEDLMNSPLGKLLSRMGITQEYLRNGEIIPPVSRGLGLSMVPRPERLYFGFTERIDTTRYEGKDDDEKAVYDLRDRVRDAIRDEIARLHEYRKKDRETSWIRRLINRFG
jgi:1-acyl-sn-glycerol-3-phosphate acyltransferase